MAGDETAELFDEPSRWRAQAVRELGLTGLEMASALGAGAAVPAVLHTLTEPLHFTRADVIVDLGAGMGGVAHWLGELTGATVVAVEPARGSRLSAAELFPNLVVRDGTADDAPVPDGAAAAVTAIGLCSLLPDVEPMLAEARRLLRPGGWLGVADLVAANVDVLEDGCNTFRSLDHLVASIADAGFDIVHLGCGDAAPRPDWAALQQRVDAVVAQRHAHDPRFRPWRDDAARLQSLIAAGDLLGGCVLARL